MLKYLKNLTVVFALLCCILFSACCVWQEPNVYPSSDNPEIMICEGRIPCPDVIAVYTDGEKTEYAKGEKKFEEIWKTVAPINGASLEFYDSILNEEVINSKKEKENCFEFFYDHVYDRGSNGNHSYFKRIFFHYEKDVLFYGYCNTDAEGNYLESFTGGIGITTFQYNNLIEKIKQAAHG